MQSSSRAGPAEIVDWEDKYRRLYEKNKELQAKCNEKDDTIKKLQTKVRKLENDFNQLERLKGGEGLPRAPKLSREDEELVPTLYDQINKLKGQNAQLIEKNKELTDVLEKKKRELAVSKKVLQAKKPSATAAPTSTTTSTFHTRDVIYSPSDIEILPGPTKVTSSIHIPTIQDQNIVGNIGPPDANLLEIAKKYKARLAIAEEQVNKLREENARLQLGQSSGHGHSKDSNTELEAKLRDATWRLQQLQTQYDYLASKSAAQNTSFKSSETQIEEYAKKVRDLRRALEDLRYEKELTDAKADRVSELQDQVIELRQTNRNLEEKIARLCETPFISESFKHSESQMHYQDLVKEREQLLSKVDHLQEAVRTNYSALTTLKHDIVKLRNENQELNKQNEEMKLKYSELEVNSNVLESKLKLYSGDDGIDLESLEKALTLVKRKSDALQRLPFLESVNDEHENMLLTLPSVKRKLEESQIVNIKLSEEIEKLENMLRLQTNINRDLHAELEILVRKRETDLADLKNNLSDLESLSKKRLKKIQSLEAQLRQYVYHTAKKKGGKVPSIVEEVESVDDTDTALLNDFIDEAKDGNIKSDENLLQIWCKSGEFKDGIIQPGSSTFIVVDFFDFESQTTNLQVGNKPMWDCGITFKLVVDDHLIRFLATEVVILEVNMAIGGDYTILSRVSLPLSGLLRVKPVVRLENHPLLSVDTGELIGHINLDLRLALPISELYRLYLERHPTEKRYIEDLSTRRLIEASTALEQAKLITDMKTKAEGIDPSEESRLYNELEISIIRAKDLPVGRDGKPPSSYIYFQLLSFPDKFTNPVPFTCDPQYNEKFSYPLFTNDQTLRLLRTSRFLITVLDMNAEELGDKEEGLIGEAAISLADLAMGNSLSSFYSIKALNGNRVGDIEIEFKWKYAFKQQRELGPRALSNHDVEVLLAAFSAEDFTIADGIVDYKSFCRYMSPPRNVSRTIDILRGHIYKLMESKKKDDQYHGSPRDIFRVIFSKNGEELIHLKEKENSKSDFNPRYEQDYFVDKLRSLHLDIVPSDYLDLFKFCDLSNNNSVSLDQFVAVLSLDDIAGIPVTLQTKLRERAADLHTRGIDPIYIFQQSHESFGVGKQGLISRLEFKQCLVALGFTLVDEPDQLLLATRVTNHHPKTSLANKNVDNTKMPSSSSRYESEHPDLLDDSYGSEDVLRSIDESGKYRYHNKIQRDQFESQRQELVQRSKDIRKETKEMSSKGTRPIEEVREDYSNVTHVGINLLNRESIPSSFGNNNISEKEGLHRSIVGPKSYDSNVVHDMATKLQSSYRGHLVRKSLSSTPSSSLSIPTRHLASTPTSRLKSKQSAATLAASSSSAATAAVTTTLEAQNILTDPSHLLAAESIIHECLKSIEGVQSPPNILGGFLIIDKKRTGYVNRAQFAHVLRQYPILKLYGIELRACMDYFDTEKDGGHIHYNAFCEFVAFQLPPFTTSVDKLHHSIVLSKQQILQLKSLDKTGNGTLSRMEIQRFFNQTGYNNLSLPIIYEICELFETKETGLVNYLNMAEFISENEISITCKELEKSLFELFETKGDALDDKVLRHWFKLIEKDSSLNPGQFTIQQFVSFLRDYDIHVPKQAVISVFGMFDVETSGLVTYSNLHRWVKAYKTAIMKGEDNLNILFVNLGIAEIQKKAAKYMLLVAKTEKGTFLSLPDINKTFELYDIPKKSSTVRSSNIDKELFVHVLTRTGFVFTKAEYRILCKEFRVESYDSNVNVHFKVNYRNFLEWATTTTTSVVSSSSSVSKIVSQSMDSNVRNSQTLVRFSGQNDGIISSKRSSVAIIKFLEAAIQRGIDLLGLFGKYDRESVGRITANDFCVALSDLGISSVTQSEAMDIGDRFKASASDFILYRRIVTELLRHADDVSGAEVIDVIDMIRSAMIHSNVEFIRLRDVFEYYDRKGQGRVHEDDMKLIFEEAGIRLRSKDIDTICDKYSMGGGSGWISYGGLLKALEYRVPGSNPMSSSSSSSHPNSMPEDLLAKLNKLIETLIFRGKDFRSEFDRYDDTFIGSISKNDFNDILQDRYKAGLSIREIEYIEKKYMDPKDSRRIIYTKFLYDIHPRFQKKSLHGNDEDSVKIHEVAENLRNKIRRRCDYTNPIELKKPYRHFARNKIRPNKVLLSDFTLAIRELGIKIPADHEEAVFDMICISNHISDEDNQKFFNFLDFVIYVCDPYYSDVEWKLRRAIARGHVSTREIIDSLHAIDTNRSGLLSTKQFEKAMKSCGLDLSDSDYSRLSLRFDIESSQRLHIDLFARFLLGGSDISSSSGGSYNINRNRVSTSQSIDHMREMEEEGEEDREDNERMVDSLHPNTVDHSSWKQRNKDHQIHSHNNMEGESAVFLNLRRRIEDKLDVGLTSNEVFAIFDVERKGLIDMASLQLGARELGMTLSRSDARSLLRRLSLLVNGPVDKIGLFKALNIDISTDSLEKRSNIRTSQRDQDIPKRMGIALDDYEDADTVNLASKRRSKVDRNDSSLSEFHAIIDSIRVKADRVVELTGEYNHGVEVLHSAFVNTDKHSGAITLKEFNNGLKDVGIRLTRVEIAKIFDVLDPDMTGQIGIEGFIRKVYSNDTSTAGNATGTVAISGSHSGKSYPVSSVEDMKSVLRRRIDLRDILLIQLKSITKRDGRSLLDLQDLFRSADRYGRNKLERREFAMVLAKFGFNFKTHEERDLVDSLAEDGGKGEIEYNSFLSALKSELTTEINIDDALDIFKRRIQHEMENNFTSLDHIFERMDRKANGSISIDDFEDALKKFKISLSRDEAKRIIATFSSDGHAIKYREFIRFLGGSSAVDRRGSVDRRDSDRRDSDRRDSDRRDSDRRDSDRRDSDRRDSDRRDSDRRDSDRRDSDRRDSDRMEDRRNRDTDNSPTSRGRGDDRTVKELIERLRSKLEDELGSRANVMRRLKDVFARIDYNGDNKISEKELMSAFDDLKLRFTESETKKVFRSIDVDRSGFIDYNEFLRLIDGKPKQSYTVSSSSPHDRSVNDLIDRLRMKLEDELGSKANVMRRLKDVFARIDYNGDNKISEKELMSAFDDLKLRFTESETKKVFRSIDVDRSGFIDYNEFLRLIDGKPKQSYTVSSSSPHDRSVNDLIDRLRMKLEDELGSKANVMRRLKDVFARIDYNGDNKISEKELMSAFDDLKLRFTESEFKKIFHSIDTDHTGFLDYNEFMRLVDGPKPAASSNSSSSRVRKDRVVDDMLDKLRSKLEDELGSKANVMRRLKDVFARIDYNGDNKISEKELMSAFDDLKLRFTESEVRRLFQHIDIDRTGFLDYNEFLHMIDPNLDGGTSSNSNISGSSIRNKPTLSIG